MNTIIFFSEDWKIWPLGALCYWVHTSYQAHASFLLYAVQQSLSTSSRRYSVIRNRSLGLREVVCRSATWSCVPQCYVKLCAAVLREVVCRSAMWSCVPQCYVKLCAAVLCEVVCRSATWSCVPQCYVKLCAAVLREVVCRSAMWSCVPQCYVKLCAAVLCVVCRSATWSCVPQCYVKLCAAVLCEVVCRSATWSCVPQCYVKLCAAVLREVVCRSAMWENYGHKKPTNTRVLSCNPPTNKVWRIAACIGEIVWLYDEDQTDSFPFHVQTHSIYSKANRHRHTHYHTK